MGITTNSTCRIRAGPGVRYRFPFPSRTRTSRISLLRSSPVRPDEHPVKLTVIIVDDEPLARSNLAVLFRLDPTVEIVAECGSGIDAPHMIRELKPDLLFLDVQMPECDGF